MDVLSHKVKSLKKEIKARIEENVSFINENLGFIDEVPGVCQREKLGQVCFAQLMDEIELAVGEKPRPPYAARSAGQPLVAPRP